MVVASFALVAFDEWRRAFAGGFIVAFGLIVVLFTARDVTWQEAVATWISLSVVWVLACALRIYRTSAARAERRAALFAADRDARARDAVAEERARLARELHDSVGHALNVVVLHAGAAQRVVGKKPELAQQALGEHRDGGPPGARRYRAHARHPARRRRGGLSATRSRAWARSRSCATRCARRDSPST